MERNLTIKINETLWNKVMSFSQRGGFDLASVIEDVLSHIVEKEEKQTRMELSDQVKDLIGILPESNLDRREERTDYLMNKY